MSVLLDLATRLETENVGTRWNAASGTGNIVLGKRIDQPGPKILALQTYPGDPSRLPGPSNVPADVRLNVQVTARDDAKDGGQYGAEQLAQAAWVALHFRHLTLNGRVYASCRAAQHPAYIGTDEQDRPLVVFNVAVRRMNKSNLT